MSSAAAAELRADPVADRLLERRVLELADQRLEEALDDHRTACGRRQPARLHVEDLRLVELADGAAVRGRDVVGADQHRGDRVELGRVGEQHRVELQVGVALLGARVDLDQALEAGLARAPPRRRASARRRPTGPVSWRSTAKTSTCSSPWLKSRPRNAMSPPGRRRRARRGGGSGGRRAAPAASGSTRRARPRRPPSRRRARRRPSPQSVSVGEPAARAVLEVELELAGVQRVAGDLAGGEVVLAQHDLGAAVGDRQRVRVLRRSRRREIS